MATLAPHENRPLVRRSRRPPLVERRRRRAGHDERSRAKTEPWRPHGCLGGVEGAARPATGLGPVGSSTVSAAASLARDCCQASSLLKRSPKARSRVSTMISSAGSPVWLAAHRTYRRRARDVAADIRTGSRTRLRAALTMRGRTGASLLSLVLSFPLVPLPAMSPSFG